MPMKGKDEPGINTEFYATMLYRVVAWMWALFPTGIFQQDNVKLHRGEMATMMLDLMPAWLTNWPPRSPDFSPIEFFWAKMEAKLAVYVENMNVTTEAQFDELIMRVFNECSTPEIINDCYIYSFKNVCTAATHDGSNLFATITWKDQYARG
jgi:hypothetical protein